MRMSGLSLDSMPPLFIPLRFFLTAPWFGVMASLLLYQYSDMLHTGRWSMETLAFTHLITLGFMLMVMIGALFQFIPVITGFAIPGSRRIAPVIHIALIIGTLLLTSGFLLAKSILFQFAIVFLLLAGGVFVIALSKLLLTHMVGKESLFLLRLVSIALLVTLALGIYMAVAYAFPELGIALRRYTDLHLIWGLLGWTILLIMTVSSQVIPMFHVTPGFPGIYLKSLSTSIILILSGLSWIYLEQPSQWIEWLGEILFSLVVLCFAAYTLYVLGQRKRKVKDITINFWRLALIMLILAVMIYWLNHVADFISVNQFNLLLGVLIIFGLTISSIFGMLQKIVSFIAYLHLQRISMSYPQGMAYLPNMQTLISVRRQEIQFYIHLLTIVAMVLVIFYPPLSLLAAILMFSDFIWLSYTISRCGLQYRQVERKIKQA